MQDKVLSVIIPVYNESETILSVIEKVLHQQCVYEIIVVDDGSTDGTTQVLKQFEILNSEPKNLKIIYKEKNQGKGSAIKLAIPHLNAEYTIIQDADLEYDPSEYTKLIEKMQQGNSVVYGSRMLSKQPISYLRYYWGGKFVTFFANCLFRTHLTDEPTGYKAFRTELIKSIETFSQGFEWESEITAKIAKKNIRIAEVPISYRPRRIEQGKKIRWKDGVKAILTLIRYRIGER
jgi:glycosyltransferase involved in cell wall biosynthesis